MRRNRGLGSALHRRASPAPHGIGGTTIGRPGVVSSRSSPRDRSAQAAPHRRARVLRSIARVVQASGRALSSTRRAIPWLVCAVRLYAFARRAFSPTRFGFADALWIGFVAAWMRRGATPRKIVPRCGGVENEAKKIAAKTTISADRAAPARRQSIAPRRPEPCSNRPAAVPHNGCSPCRAKRKTRRRTRFNVAKRTPALKRGLRSGAAPVHRVSHRKSASEPRRGCESRDPPSHAPAATRPATAAQSPADLREAA